MTLILPLVGATVLCWLYTARLGWQMPHAHLALDRAGPSVASAGDIIRSLMMWTVMMVGMMVPCAVPDVLEVARGNRRRVEQQSPIAAAAAFLSGHLAVWLGFSFLAALAQEGLRSAGLMDPSMASTSRAVDGALLLAVGAFQFTSLKMTCLKRCRDPLSFSNPVGQNGKPNAFVAGLEHGAFSAASCGLMMLILFVTGAMSFVWMSIITAFLLAERLGRITAGLSRLGGALVIGWGGWMLLGRAL